jgi:hypothetical protein
MARSGSGGAPVQSPDVKNDGSAVVDHLPAHTHPPSPVPPVVVVVLALPPCPDPPCPDPLCPDVEDEPPHATSTTKGNDRKTQAQRAIIERPPFHI